MPYIISFISLMIVSSATFAVCPLCTFTVGAGIGLGQYCGVNDIVTGLWAGGFIVSMIIFSKDWLQKKSIYFYGCGIVIAVIYYASVIIPLYEMGVMGHELNELWGIDKILLGMIIGSLTFLIGALLYEFLKKNNNNKAYFPFQKVVMPIAPLIILSVISCLFL